MKQKTILVTGSSGFIGGHLVAKLKSQGHITIGADIVVPKYERPEKFYLADLRNQNEVYKIFLENRIDEVYNLACLMGGMGIIGDDKYSHDIMTGSTMIVANVLDWSVKFGVKKLFYSSSACAYNMHLQEEADSAALKESDAYPAMPDLIYGWQKLESEIMHNAAFLSHGIDIRIARFHNIMGPFGVWDGGKEKAPAALCRKVAQAKDGDSIIVWGDGNQKRSFMYIDECLYFVEKLMQSNCKEVLNIGSDEVISIRDLAQMVIDISGKNISIEYDLTKPQGVRGRNSDNTLIEQKLGERPSYPLRAGMEKLYAWVNEQVNG